MPLPNFFIIGAPKAGTTALYDTLAKHPDICMSPIKEPCFFATKGQPAIMAGPAGSYLHRHSVWKPQEYLALFSQVTTERAIGEASPMYLRSPLAAKQIQRNIPNAKIIAILRNPAERAHSHYWHMVQKGLETASSFEEALEQEPQRQAMGWFSAFYYQANGFYHEQLSTYFALFPCEQIKVYLYEDWKNHPHSFLCDVLDFLGVGGDFLPKIQKTNVTVLPRVRRLHDWAKQKSASEDGKQQGKAAPHRRLALSLLNSLNHKYNLVPRPSLKQETRCYLTSRYCEDIEKLQCVLKRDLSSWLT